MNVRQHPELVPGDPCDLALLDNVHPPKHINPVPSGRYNLVVIGAGTAGLVTLEDLIGEIIGGIQDEHEGDGPVHVQVLSGGRLQIWGGATLRDAAERLDFTPSEEEEGYDTVAGLVFGRLNRIPVVGDQVGVASGSLRVIRMQGRRIEYLVFVPGAPDDGR